MDDDLCATANGSPDNVDGFGQFGEIGCGRKFKDNRGRFAFARGVIQVQIRFGILPWPWRFLEFALEAQVEAEVFWKLIDRVVVNLLLRRGQCVQA